MRFGHKKTFIITKGVGLPGKESKPASEDMALIFIWFNGHARLLVKLDGIANP
jgi:hypothetical protein